MNLYFEFIKQPVKIMDKAACDGIVCDLLQPYDHSLDTQEVNLSCVPTHRFRVRINIELRTCE